MENVRQRLLRSVAALEAAGIPYAVVGGNAVAVWVSQVNEGLVRFTQDVDILIRRKDLAPVIAAMEAAGFVYAEVSGVHLFVDGPSGKPSMGVHLLFAGEKVDPRYTTAAATLDETARGPEYQVVSLEALVRMKLESNRDKDRTHVRDLIGAGLIDDTWPDRFPESLAERLRHMLATPGG